MSGLLTETEPTMERPTPPDDFATERRGLSRLGRRWAWILGGGFLGAVAGVAMTLAAAPVYEARTTLLFPSRPSSLLNISSALSSIGASLGSSLAGPSPLKMTQSVLESDSTLDLVQRQVPGTRKQLLRSRRFVLDAPTNTIQILCTSTSKEKAAAQSRAYVSALGTLNSKLNIEALSSDEGVLFQQYNARSAQLANAENRLRKFQEGSQTFPTFTITGAGDNTAVVAVPGPFAAKLAEVDLQIQSLDGQVAEAKRRLAVASRGAQNLPTDIPSVRVWRETLVRLQYDLERASVTYGPDDPQIIRLTRDIAITKRRLTDETNRAVQAIQTGVVDTGYAQALAARTIASSQREALARLAAAAPGEALQLQRLVREVGALTAIVTRLRGQLGLAQIQGKSSGSQFQVLDDARIDEPINKSKASGAARFGAIGLIFGTIAAFLPFPRRRTARNRPSESATAGR